jgi:hypothetical protein
VGETEVKKIEKPNERPIPLIGLIVNTVFEDFTLIFLLP